MQTVSQHFGGKVEKGTIGEYGKAEVHYTDEFKIKGVADNFKAWMSHSDHLCAVPNDFKTI